MSIYSIGLSGLQASSEDLDAISQNISNSSTAGYKSIDTSFSASYSGSTASGVSVAGTTQSFDEEGDLVSTDSSLDVAISGTGFFILDNGDGSYAYTRAGSFSMDSNYNIVASNGMNLEGYGVDDDGNIISGILTNLSVDSSIPAEATSTITQTANLNADATTIATTSTFDPDDGTTYNYSVTSSVYDSQGSTHTLSEYFVKTDDNTWSVYYTLDGNTVTDSTGATQVDTLTFDSDGALTSPTSALSVSATLTTGVDTLSISIPVTDITQYATSFSSTTDADGYAAGNYSSVSIDDDGSIYATYDNGETVLQGQIALASFVNPNGLDAADGTVWYATSASGAATIGIAGSGSLGTLTSGSYENSNVDVSSELVDLMTAQQVYQANAKVLSAADDLASVLFNTF
jgi:flagellar hook protein FlgE